MSRSNGSNNKNIANDIPTTTHNTTSNHPQNNNTLSPTSNNNNAFKNSEMVDDLGRL